MTAFRWFSERVADCLALPADQGLDALRKLIDEAAADKQAGYGPSQDDINRARRQWLDLYDTQYGKGLEHVGGYAAQVVAKAGQSMLARKDQDNAPDDGERARRQS